MKFVLHGLICWSCRFSDLRLFSERRHPASADSTSRLRFRLISPINPVQPYPTSSNPVQQELTARFPGGFHAALYRVFIASIIQLFAKAGISDIILTGKRAMSRQSCTLRCNSYINM
jgi:hypothetical protein